MASMGFEVLLTSFSDVFSILSITEEDDYESVICWEWKYNDEHFSSFVGSVEHNSRNPNKVSRILVTNCAEMTPTIKKQSLCLHQRIIQRNWAYFCLKRKLLMMHMMRMINVTWHNGHVPRSNYVLCTKLGIWAKSYPYQYVFLFHGHDKKPFRNPNGMRMIFMSGLMFLAMSHYLFQQFYFLEDVFVVTLVLYLIFI